MRHMHAQTHAANAGGRNVLDAVEDEDGLGNLAMSGLRESKVVMAAAREDKEI